MAFIVKDPRNGNWRVRYRDPDGRQRSRHFKTKAEATRYRYEVEHSKNEGTYLDPAAGRTPYRAIAEQWLATRVHLKPRTYVGYRNILQDRLVPAFGSKPVASITKATVRAYIAAMQKDDRAPQTIRNCFYVLQASLNLAVEDGALRANPCAGVKLPTNSSTGREVEMYFLTAEEVATLAAAIRPPYGTLIYFAAYTGLRAGEIVALTVADVDFLRRRVAVRASISEVDGKLQRDATKTGRARKVAMPRFLADMLAAYLAANPRGPAELLFDDPKRPGSWLRHNVWYATHFKPAVKATNLPPGLRFHDLRHTAASLMIRQGASIKAVQAQLGHATASMTLDKYGHLYPDELDSLTDALDRAYAAAQ